MEVSPRCPTGENIPRSDADRVIFEDIYKGHSRDFIMEEDVVAKFDFRDVLIMDDTDSNELGELFVEDCCICKKLLCSEEELKQHEEEITRLCGTCESCMTPDSEAFTHCVQ